MIIPHNQHFCGHERECRKLVFKTRINVEQAHKKKPTTEAIEIFIGTHISNLQSNLFVGRNLQVCKFCYTLVCHL